MPEIIRVLTDDQGTITHLVTDEEERLSSAELAAALDQGKDYYVTFGDDLRYTITMVAEDGRLEPTVDDADGVHSIWDLPQEEDPAEEEIEEMFDEMSRMGEFDEDNFDGPDRNEKDVEGML